MVDLVARLGLDRPPDHSQHVVAILRVQQRQIGVEAAVERARLQSEQSLQPLVPRDRARCDVPSPRPQVTGVERQPEVLGQISRLLLGQPLFGHVVRGRHGPHDRPVLTPQRGHDGEHPKRRSITAQHAEVARPRLATDDRAEHLASGLRLGGELDDVRDPGADHLVCRPAVERLRDAVPTDDHSVDVGDDDRAGKGVEHPLGSPEGRQRQRVDSRRHRRASWRGQARLPGGTAVRSQRTAAIVVAAWPGIPTSGTAQALPRQSCRRVRPRSPSSSRARPRARPLVRRARPARRRVASALQD